MYNNNYLFLLLRSPLLKLAEFHLQLVSRKWKMMPDRNLDLYKIIKITGNGNYMGKYMGFVFLFLKSLWKITDRLSKNHNKDNVRFITCINVKCMTMKIQI